MKPLISARLGLALVALFGVGAPYAATTLKDLARVGTQHETPLVGYGIVTGLAGTGDSPRNRSTMQSIANVLARFGARVEVQDLAGRNAAAVMVSATLPAFAEKGHPLDVQVSSLGDARSLTGGILLLTPMYAPDERLYALAKGSVIVGGYQFEAPGAQNQKNFPTAGTISNGAIVERAASGDDLPTAASTVSVLLHEPDYSMAQTLADAIGAHLPGVSAEPVNPGKIEVSFNQQNPVRLIAALERVPVLAEALPRIVVNERTGTVVSGGDVRLAAVSISHGELRVEVKTTYKVSQPGGGLLIEPGDGIATVVVPDSEIKVDEPRANVVSVSEGTAVGELIGALRAIRLSTRDIIAILQAIKAAGALRGELVIQ